MSVTESAMEIDQPTQWDTFNFSRWTVFPRRSVLWLPWSVYSLTQKGAVQAEKTAGVGVSHIAGF